MKSPQTEHKGHDLFLKSTDIKDLLYVKITIQWIKQKVQPPGYSLKTAAPPVMDRSLPRESYSLKTTLYYKAQLQAPTVTLPHNKTKSRYNQVSAQGRLQELSFRIVRYSISVRKYSACRHALSFLFYNYYFCSC